MAQERFVGKVKWFSASKGYGFIGKVDDDQPWFTNSNDDIFVHYSAISASGYKKLDIDQVVSFVVATGHAGKLQAEQVVNLDNENTEAVA